MTQAIVPRPNRDQQQALAPLQRYRESLKKYILKVRLG